MRRLTFVTVMLLAVPALAQKAGKADAAVAGAKAALDQADEAFNKGDAKALNALLDKSFFMGGPYVSSLTPDVETAKAQIEKMFANGPIAKMTRGETTIHADESGDAAWYVAEYTFVPKVGPGVLPVHRKIRESGVLLKHGKEWKFALVHQSHVQPDPPPPAPPKPATPPPAAK